MKKIIAAFDGLKFSVSTCMYAVEIAKQASAHLVGVFLDDRTYHSYKIYDVLREEKEGFSEAKQRKLDAADENTRAAAVQKFEEACRKAGQHYSLRHDKNIALQELLHESIYADLLIMDHSETLTHYTEKIPTRFIRDMLQSVQCPVLLVPQKYRPIEKLTLLYDGEPSSVYAIKMFSYTLAALKSAPAGIVTVKSINQSLHVPDNALMKEFSKRHFPKATYTVLKGLPETEIVQHLKEQKGFPLVVLGAYRRSVVSRWYRASMADILMKELKLPLFIAHT